MRDCRVNPKDENVGIVRISNLVEDYIIFIDGEPTIQNQMFTRADMKFWGFSANDVIPPVGYTLNFWGNKHTSEPYFEKVR